MPLFWVFLNTFNVQSRSDVLSFRLYDVGVRVSLAWTHAHSLRFSSVMLQEHTCLFLRRPYQQNLIFTTSLHPRASHLVTYHTASVNLFTRKFSKKPLQKVLIHHLVKHYWLLFTWIYIHYIKLILCHCTVANFFKYLHMQPDLILYLCDSYYHYNFNNELVAGPVPFLCFPMLFPFSRVENLLHRIHM